MERRFSNSPALFLWLIALGGMVRAGAFICVIPPFHRGGGAGLARMFLVMIAGFSIQEFGQARYGSEIRADRWPSEATQRSLRSPVWKFLTYPLLALGVISFLIVGHLPFKLLGFSFFLLALTMVTLTACVQPKETPLPQIDPTDMTPLRSDHWGEDSRPPLTS